VKIYPSDLTPPQVEILRTIENFGRRELSAAERAIAVARVLDALLKESDKGVLNPAVMEGGAPCEFVARQLGFNAGWVRDHAYVSRLGGVARELLQAGRISLGHARELAKLGDPELADRFAEQAARGTNGTGGYAVERLATLVTQSLRSLKVVPWKLDVAFGRDVPGCTGHACVTCPFNSKSDPDLFGGALADQPEAGFCTHPTCFEAKTKIAAKAVDQFVARAAKAKKADKTMAITETTLVGAGVKLPEEVKAATAVRKAKKELEPEGEKKSAAGGRSSGSVGYRQTPKEIAKDKYRAAEQNWRRASSDALEAHAIQEPGLVAASILLYEGIGCNSYDLREPRDLSPHLPLLKQAVDGNWAMMADTLAHQFRKQKNRRDNFGVFVGAPGAALLDYLAEGWKVSLPPRPKLEDFLPKAKLAKAKDAPPPKDATAKAPAKKKASAKKSKKGNAPPVEVITHDVGPDDFGDDGDEPEDRGFED
jgi:hypothetical protein